MYWKLTLRLLIKSWCFISQAIIQLLLYKLNPTIKYFAYLWLHLKESLAVDTFHAYLRYLFVTRYS